MNIEIKNSSDTYKVPCGGICNFIAGITKKHGYDFKFLFLSTNIIRDLMLAGF